MLQSGTMLNVEVVLLKTFQPTRNLPFWIPELQEPPQCCMVSSDDKGLAIEVGIEVTNALHNCQQLSSGGTVVMLGTA